MLNNEDEGSNPQVPDEIKDTIEKYKNQITDLEIEARRIQKLLAEKQLELANTSNEIKSNNDITDRLEKGKQLKANQVLELEKEIAKKETKSKELEAENLKSVEDVDKRVASISKKEAEVNAKVADYEVKNAKLAENISCVNADKEEIEKKKQILLETISKL